MLILEIEYIGEIMKDSLRFKDVKKLILLANDLDKSGLHKEADFIDSFILKLAETPPPPAAQTPQNSPKEMIEFEASGKKYSIPKDTTGNYTLNGQEVKASPNDIVELLTSNMSILNPENKRLARMVIARLKTSESMGAAGAGGAFGYTDSWSISASEMDQNAPDVKNYILSEVSLPGSYQEFEFYVSAGKLYSQGNANAMMAVAYGLSGGLAIPAAMGIEVALRTLKYFGVVSESTVNGWLNFINLGLEIPLEKPGDKYWKEEIKYILQKGSDEKRTGAESLSTYYGVQIEQTPEEAPKPPEAGAGGGAAAGGAGAGAAGAGEVARRAPTERRTVSGDLKLGSSGPRVSRLHNQLARLGYDIPSDEVSSQSFGNGTEAAVKRFQREQGLAQTGVVNAATQGKLDRALGGGGRTATEPRERVSSLDRKIETIAGGEAGVYEVASAGGNVFAIVDRDPYRNNPRISTRERYQWAVKGAKGDWMIYNQLQHKNPIFNSKGNRLREMLREREGRIKMQATTARRSRR